VRSFQGTYRAGTPDQGNLKVSSSLNRLQRRYRRLEEAVMNSRKPEDLVFETTVGCTLVAAVAAFTALLYQLITTAVPLLESMLAPQVR
jgi:hypothetical protein